jgi:hypothetical protein
VVRSRWGVSIACLLVCQWIQEDYTTSCCLPRSAAEMHHRQLGTAANVPVILICDVPYVFVSVDVGPSGNISCDIQDPILLYAECQYSYAVLLME